MAWYTDRKKVNYTQTYSDKAAAAEDAQKAAEYGWEVDQESSAQGSMNDATWVAGGPMGQFFGGNHQRFILPEASRSTTESVAALLRQFDILDFHATHVTVVSDVQRVGQAQDRREADHQLLFIAEQIAKSFVIARRQGSIVEPR